MKNKDTIGVAFLGVGRMGETHLRNLTAISGIKVVAVADLILERAERGRQITGAELAVTDSAKAIELVNRLVQLKGFDHIAGLESKISGYSLGNDLEALIKLLKRGWFSRRWVVQVTYTVSQLWQYL